MMKSTPRYVKAAGMSYAHAVEKGFLQEGLISAE